MSISFERFLTLTAALAAASATMSGCGGDDDSTATPGGGTSAGKTSAGGAAAGKAGSASGGTSAGGTSTGGKGTGGARGGGAGTSTGGSSGTTSGAGGEEPESGGAGAGTTETGGSNAGGRGGVSGSENNGGESAAGMTSSNGGVPNGGVPNGGGEGGDHTGGAGAGADEGPCFGDVGATDCFSLSAGDLPSDECATGMNPPMRSCLYSESNLRPGVIDGLGSCLVPITDPCTIGAADATDICERKTLRRACPSSEAADACANGIDLGGGSSLPSPLTVCTDGTLTQTSCTAALSAVTADALQNVVTCSDPAGYYGHYFSGTCAERLQFCIFPHATIYF